MLNDPGGGTRANSLGEECAWTSPTEVNVDDSPEIHTENANVMEAFRRTAVEGFVDLSVDSSFLLDCSHLEPDGSRTAVGAIASTNQYDENSFPKENAKHVNAATDTKSKDPVRGLSENCSQSGLLQCTDPPRIRVIVRKRPLNSKELEKGEVDVIQCEPECSCLSVHEPKTKVDMTRYIESHRFRFDDVFDENMDNDTLYINAVRPLVATVFRSGRGTCFAYGQTGSGKTYTMQPLPLRAAADIFQISATIPLYKDLKMYVSCYEIYGGKIFDLLNSRKRLEVREDAKRRVQVVGLKEVRVSILDDLVQLCNHAASSRSTGSTGANDESSRSHSIMTFALQVPKEEEEDANLPVKERVNTQNPGDHSKLPMKKLGRLSFIDLAGSERGADTYENDKQTRLEGAEINKSLLALKECIRALDMDAGHVPFRGSKLTSVLRDSFLGKNARTVMIANISPCSSSCEHTLNTLRYADRVKEMKKESGEKSDRKSDGFAPDNVLHVLMNLPAPDIAVNGNVGRGSSGQSSFSSQKVERRSTTSTQRDSRCFIETVTSQYDAHRGDTDGGTIDSVFSISQQSTSNLDGSSRPARRQFDEELPLLHQQQIEDTMHILKQEMDLLANLDPNDPESISLPDYLQDLQTILARRSASLSLLQRKVDACILKQSSNVV